MSEPERDFKKIYEEIMRSAGERKRILSQRALERERVYREQANKRLSRTQRAEADRARAMLARVRHEIEKALGKLERTADKEERVFLKAEIAHLRALIDQLSGKKGKRRKPPEAGIAVPAVPPKGPLPKQGGAEAPLDYDTGA